MFLFKKKKNELSIHPKTKLGLALGGGGARGFAHIGIIKAFEELGVDFDYIAGTSVGSIVGAAYADGLSSSQMIDFAKTLKKKDVSNSKFFWVPSKSKNIEDLMDELLGKGKLFSELKKPFKAVATDIKSGKEIILDCGYVAVACSASSAVPGVFTPVVWEDMHLVDGGLKNNIPADIVRAMGADIVIAVDVNCERGSGTTSLKTLKLLSSTIGVLMQGGVEKKLLCADFCLKPILTQFKSTEIKNIDAMIDEGYRSVMDNKENLIKVLNQKPSKRKKKLWEKRIKRI